MLMLIDDADLRNIEELYSKYPYDGVTTNPTILSKTGNPDPMDQLKQIRSLIPSDAMLHAQVLSVETEDMVREAKYMVSVLGKDTFIKVPVTENGLKAISILSSLYEDAVLSKREANLLAATIAKSQRFWQPRREQSFWRLM